MRHFFADKKQRYRSWFPCFLDGHSWRRRLFMTEVDFTETRPAPGLRYFDRLSTGRIKWLRYVEQQCMSGL